MNTVLVLFMIITIALLFFGMVLSAVSANEARKGGTSCRDGSYKYSTWTAVISGISAGLMAIILIIYIFTSRHKIAAGVGRHFGNANDVLGQYAARGGYVA